MSDYTRMRANDGPLSPTGEHYPLGITFDNGAGTVYALDMDLKGGYLMMSRRDKALATAMLELALENVTNSQEQS
jgi:hypothetical protein